MQEEDALRDTFNSYDIDKDGVLDSEEAAQLLVDAGGQVDLESAREIVKSMDVSNSGSICWDDFKQASLHVRAKTNAPFVVARIF